MNYEGVAHEQVVYKFFVVVVLNQPAEPIARCVVGTSGSKIDSFAVAT